MTFPELPELLLMRHGETEWNAEKRMQGRLNSALTETGRAQARALRDLLARFDLSSWALMSSPQGRALATAGLALGAAVQPIRTDDRLMEIDVGEWSGLGIEDVKAARPDLFVAQAERFAWYDEAPGGEGWRGLEARCRSFLNDIKGPTLCVTHGITLRMLRSLASCGTVERFHDEDFVTQGVIWHVREGDFQRIET